MQTISTSLFNEASVPQTAPQLAPSRNTTPIARLIEARVKETHSHYLVSIKVPHVKKEDLKIELKRNKQLFVRGCFGNFFHTVTFASAIQSENVKASLVEGILQLLLPKAIPGQMSFH